MDVTSTIIGVIIHIFVMPDKFLGVIIHIFVMPDKFLLNLNQISKEIRRAL